MGEQADHQRVKVLLKQDNPSWMQRRLMVLKMSFNPENSIAHIADSAGVGTRSVDRWLALYRSRGLEAVLTRGTDKNRRPSKINDEILDYLNKGLESQR